MENGIMTKEQDTGAVWWESGDAEDRNEVEGKNEGIKYGEVGNQLGEWWEDRRMGGLSIMVTCGNLDNLWRSSGNLRFSAIVRCEKDVVMGLCGATVGLHFHASFLIIGTLFLAASCR